MPGAAYPMDADAVRAFLREVQQTRGHAPQAVALALPAPAVDPLRLWNCPAAAEAATVLCEGDVAQASVGCEVALHAEGAQRLATLQAASEAFWPKWRLHQHPSLAGQGVPTPTLRLFGGIAFAAGGAATPEWQGFGDASLHLPRWTYRVNLASRHASLVWALKGDRPQDGNLDALVDEWHATTQALQHPSPQAAFALQTQRTEAVAHEATAWQAAATDILANLRSGSVQKVVLSRRASWQSETPMHAVTTLNALRRRFPQCMVFGFRRGDACFVGATPELLVRKQGNALHSAAIAGTATAAGAARLQASEKDLQEHRYVVDWIVERLRRLQAEPVFPEAPQLRVMPGLCHLVTPVEAHAAASTPVLRFVETLHPTPAVAGVPLAGALRLIATHEPHARGWYGGPIGWCDAQGDGAFHVALRCALLRGKQAMLFAGSGWVEGSDARAEWQETELKMQAMQHALGIS